MEKIDKIDKRFLNILVIIFLTLLSFGWTFWIFHKEFIVSVVVVVIAVRIVASYLIFKDYSLSWSRATGKSFLIKSVVNIVSFFIYMPIFYDQIAISFFVSELFVYLFMINFSMYLYHYFANTNSDKRKSVVLYGSCKAGLLLENEFRDSEYDVKCFIDDKSDFQKRSIDGKVVFSREKFKQQYKNQKIDLLIIAVPNANRERIKEIYENLNGFAHSIKILPAIDKMLQNKPILNQLIDVSVEDLLARHPKGLDRTKVEEFLKDKVIMVTGAGGSVGSEISRQCAKYGVKKIILAEHYEYALYRIEEELIDFDIESKIVTVSDKISLRDVFKQYRPQIVIHAAAFKHVPLVEHNIYQAINNNIVGTKNCIDLAIEYGVEKFVLVSTDKAVRPTNVMGTTKRICELYAQNRLMKEKNSKTEIVAVRFGNVLGSSGSVIPKFKKQICEGGPITVTHPDITRYFMLIPEACELVLQAGAMGKGGEVFILDMGDPVKIVDLAKKLIELSRAKNIEIEFSGLRPGEKLYEELLIDDTDCNTDYEGITIAKSTKYDIDKLNNDIDELMNLVDDEARLVKLKEIVPEFNHNRC